MKNLGWQGKAVPNLDFVTLDGEQKNLSDFHGKWVFLLFRRYLGCPVCRMDVDRLTLDKAKPGQGDLFQNRGLPDDVEVIIVIQSGENVLRETLEGQMPGGMTAVPDPNGVIFKRFGIGKAGLTQYAGPRVMLQVARAIREGYRRGRREGEERQLPADLIIDPKGIIRFVHLAADISDTTSLEELFRIKERVSS